MKDDKSHGSICATCSECGAYLESCDCVGDGATHCLRAQGWQKAKNSSCRYCPRCCWGWEAPNVAHLFCRHRDPYLSWRERCFGDDVDRILELEDAPADVLAPPHPALENAPTPDIAACAAHAPPPTPPTTTLASSSTRAAAEDHEDDGPKPDINPATASPGTLSAAVVRLVGPPPAPAEVPHAAPHSSGPPTDPAGSSGPPSRATKKGQNKIPR